MFKKFIIGLFFIIACSQIISMEQTAENFSHYENLPLEITEVIAQKYIKSVIDGMQLPIGENSLNEFSYNFKTLIKNIRLVNRTNNALVVSLKSYAIVLLVQKFNELSQGQKLDCLTLYLKHKKNSLATIALLSFLDISTMDISKLTSYIGSQYERLYGYFKEQRIYTAKDPNFILHIKGMNKKKLRLLLEIQSNIPQKLLFNINYWINLAISNNYKGLLKVLLNNYKHIQGSISNILLIEAAIGDIDGINKLSNKNASFGRYRLTAIHSAIIGNPTNLQEVLDLLFSEIDLKNLALQHLQLMLRLATNWSDHNIVNYLLSQFQTKLPYDTFMKIMNQSYKSGFPWDNLNTPLAHAIKCTNNKDYENIILTLINYGADLNCIKSIELPKLLRSPFVFKLIANKQHINEVINALNIIKEANIDQPYTMENIMEACQEASKPQPIPVQPARPVNIRPSMTQQTPRRTPVRTAVPIIYHIQTTQIPTPIIATQMKNDKNYNTNNKKNNKLSSTQIRHTLKDKIVSYVKSNPLKISLGVVSLAIGAWLGYKIVKNHSKQKPLNKFKKLKLSDFIKSNSL